MRGTVKRIEWNPLNPPVPTEIQGEFSELPTVGKNFFLFHDGHYALITTLVRHFQYDHKGNVKFWTENSMYYLEIEDEQEKQP